ncbi:hypothetical protein D3C81_1216540 [compost metagenome]
MSRDVRKLQIVNRLGGARALITYMDSNRVETAKTRPAEKTEVLADFRPHGFIVLLGYDEDLWRHPDTGAQYPHAPNAWAYCPE